MQEVSFPCPMCREKLTFDRRTIQTAGPVPVAGGDLELGQTCLVVGNADPATVEAVHAIGFQPQHFEAAEAARDFFQQEFPAVIVLRPAQVTIPPLAEMMPITSMNPADRRKAFIILVADNLRTFDGNAAFLYGVNLVVNSKDLGSIRKIYREAEIHHRRLYEGMASLERAS
jgi:hypothetical protein